MYERPKTQREKFIEEIAKTPFVAGLTTSIFANEYGARVLLKILMDKGIVTNEDWVAACREMDKIFVDLHTVEYDEEYEPSVLDFTPEKGPDPIVLDFTPKKE